MYNWLNKTKSWSHKKGSKKSRIPLIEKKSQFNNWLKKSRNWSEKSGLQLIEKHRTDWNIKHNWSKNSPLYNWSKNGQLFEYQAQLIEYLPLQLIEKQTNDR